MEKILYRLVNIASSDPDDARRRKLLNILLAGTMTVALLALLAALYLDWTDWYSRAELVWLYQGGLSILIGALVIYVINRLFSGQLAAWVFLLFVILLITVIDDPQQVVSGRSLLMFAFPIFMASVLIRSYASFIMAALTSILIFTIAANLQIDLVPSMTGALVFFLLALISWLAARSLELALIDLRILNRELDQRVAVRTHELATALAENTAILESIADGVIVFDNDGRAIVANPATSRLLERPSTTIVGADIDSLLGKEVGVAAVEEVSGFLQHKEATTPGFKFNWGDKTLSVSFAPVRDDQRRVTGTVAVLRDFTREAEVDRMKSALVSMVSHELRTPLNAILGYAEMLQAAVYGNLEEKQYNAVGRILANSGQLLSLVNNLLDQAQIEAGRLILYLTPFAPRELVGDVISVMSVLAQSKGLELSSEVVADVPPRLVGDRQRLHQILVNLVGNSVKFTEEGGVRVRVYLSDESHWALKVSDTGCGIAPDAQKKVFDPFQRADNSATRKQAGAGLGLSIVKQLVDLMGGDITLTSQVGHGSTFTIVLPLVIPLEERS